MGKFKMFIQDIVKNSYGVDEFCKFLISFSLFLWILDIFIKSNFIYWLYTILVIIVLFRVFSKNYEKRQKENSKYIKLRNIISNKVKFLCKKWKDRKTHIYRVCPNCKAKIRLPKIKGKHVCMCPCCKNDFKVQC